MTAIQIRPILSMLRRQRTAATLIVLEIALSCAIICNALFLIGERVERLNVPSGIAEDELVVVALGGFGSDAQAAARTRSDLEQLRAIPGVEDATLTTQLPFGGSSGNTDVELDPAQTHASANLSMYMGGDHMLQTFGLQLVAGRDFNPGEFVTFDPQRGFGGLEVDSVIITRDAARGLFPGESALGRDLYVGDRIKLTVVGVVAELMMPNDYGAADYSMVLPVRLPYTMDTLYVLRTEPEQRVRVLEKAVEVLWENGPERLLLGQRTYSEIRYDYFRGARAMIGLMAVVCIALLVVTALGIAGLTNFWVTQRTKQIGIRRALGATRGDILRHFQTENFLIVGFGVALGMGLAYAINLGLMSRFELARLPAWYLPVGALVLWVIGQLSVLAPARRAASVPPAVATRSV